MEDLITQLECISSSIIRYLRQIQAVRRLRRSMNLLVRCALATTFILLYDDYKDQHRGEGEAFRCSERTWTAWKAESLLADTEAGAASQILESSKSLFAPLVKSSRHHQAQKRIMTILRPNITISSQVLKGNM